jgi:hypothetical protein
MAQRETATLCLLIFEESALDITRKLHFSFQPAGDMTLIMNSLVYTYNVT